MALSDNLNGLSHYAYLEEFVRNIISGRYFKKEGSLKFMLRKLLERWESMQLGFKFAASLQGIRKLWTFWTSSTAYGPEEVDSQKTCPQNAAESHAFQSLCPP